MSGAGVQLSRRERLGRLRAGMRTLSRQELPSREMFPAADVDLVHMKILRRHYVVSRSPGHVERVFIEAQDRYAKAVHYRLLAAVTGDGLLTSEGDHWASQRRLIQPMFTKRHIDQLVVHMREAVEGYLARWRPAAPPQRTDVSAAMTELTLDVVGRALFGASMATAAERLRPAVATGMTTALMAARVQMVLGIPGRAIDAIGRAVYRIPLPPPVRGVRRAMHTIDDVVIDIIDQRLSSPRRDGTEDLLDLLLDAADEDGAPMPRQQVRDELVTLMLAGHDTTANGLSWFWHLLACHPDIHERIVGEVATELGGRSPDAADLDRLVWTRAAFSEALRLYPPAWVLEREAIVPDRLGDLSIPEGATIIFPVHLIHRDPRWWPDPDRFDPTRFLPDAPTPARGTYLPFGFGRRICVGANFALTEAVLIAAMLLQRYRFEDPSGVVPRPSATVTLRPRDGLPMEVHPNALSPSVV